MSRKKLAHFQDIKDWPHVLEYADKPQTQGKWGPKVILELACGHGYYTLELARRHPAACVVGVDIKGGRIWHGAKYVLDEGLDNAYFLRIFIEDLAEYFAPGEVDEIWITFPDPHPRKGKAKKRLTSPRFLAIYKELLKPGGRVHLKTDDPGLFDYTLETVLQEGWRHQRVVPDVYAPKVEDDLLHVQTAFEKRHLAMGRTIRYVAFAC